ncbi:MULTISPECIES: glycosyltransferase family 2 protein [unclassified Lysobacter]|uniref:glycosyltransferase family 2 protein n=1 Tax=unclassified Lysobacter TaxID=2635362 RepID=UPI001F5609D4|nr:MULTISPECIES: glycosyltransferase family 2 protein [unclassified Lysobacter]HEX5662495.1 glycosyltransferase family 2 protein [Xanthomonadaceae bacterium]
MATAPWFVLSPNALLSAIGLLRGPDKTIPTPAEDWRTAVVDVVVPAYKEEDNIIHCLASLARQTVRPRQIILVEDGSKDQTVPRAREYAQAAGLDLVVIERNSSIGKTPTIKRQAREFDSDVEFILDGDTFLESPDYIERCVQELYQGIGIASACGVVLPMRPKDRHELAQSEEFQRWHGAPTYDDPHRRRGLLHSLWWWITNAYRECLYMFLQRFVYKGQMVFFGSITNPVGCAVAYRRKYIKDLFDRYEPIFGDDLTNSEDIFIGFALNNEGYRNIQLQDVQARSEEPEVQRLPRQVYLWSSSFLQSCYYFDPLLRSPFKSFKRWRKRRKDKQRGIEELRLIKEQYRQPFGDQYTKEYGRPVGWAMLLSAIEKIGFPTALIVMTILRMWEPLAVTLIAEVIVSLAVLFTVGTGRRLEMVLKGIVMTPVRYAMILADTITISRFAIDLWITGNRKWRK